MWDQFSVDVPTTDDVVEYIKTHPGNYYIPFEGILFGKSSISEQAFIEQEKSSKFSREASKVKSAISVKFKGEKVQNNRLPYEVDDAEANENADESDNGDYVDIVASSSRRKSNIEAKYYENLGGICFNYCLFMLNELPD